MSINKNNFVFPFETTKLPHKVPESTDISQDDIETTRYLA